MEPMESMEPVEMVKNIVKKIEWIWINMKRTNLDYVNRYTRIVDHLNDIEV